MTPSEENAAAPAISKATIREQIYKDFDAKGLDKIVERIKLHIPKFSTAHEAAARIAELPEYQNATAILTKTGPTLESVRIKALQDKKKLLIPIPTSLKTGMLFLVDPPEEEDEKALKKYISGSNLPQHSKIMPADESLHVDMVVLGSVAVDRQGRRVGSGKDYCDLELAVMAQKGMITEKTVVVTVVHEAQVVDCLPEELFGEHDVRVKIILTPTEIIRVEREPAKPAGIIWQLLTKRTVRLVPVLREMHEKEREAGVECKLKVEERRSTKEGRPRRPRLFSRRRKPSGDKSTETVEGVDGVRGAESADGEGERGGDGGDGGDRPRRRSYRKSKRRVPKSEGDEEHQEGREAEKSERPDEVTQNGDNSPLAKGGRPRRAPRKSREGEEELPRPRRLPFRRRFPIEFSLRVGNIAPDVRVRDLKNALAECRVKPAEIRWNGQSAVLHFARYGRQETDSPVSMDGVITSLRNLNVSGAGGGSISVEPFTRVTRIEVTNEVTAV